MFGVDAQGFVELIFKDDDVAGGPDAGALVDALAGADGSTQPVAGIAAAAALEARAGGEMCSADRAEEALGGSEYPAML